MDLDLIVDKSHRILGEVNGLEDDLADLNVEMNELQEAVRQLRSSSEQKTTGLVQMVAVSQANQLGVFLGLGLVGLVLLMLAVLLCAILRRTKRMKVR